MITLLDNTVLSNFSLVGRTELIQQALGETAASTQQVMLEFQAGMELGRLPETDLNWLELLALSSTEQPLYEQLLDRLNAGEASCLAIAVQRNAIVLTDDQDARKLAAQMQVATSGTLGILLRMIKIGHLTLEEANSLLSQMVAHGYRSPVETLGNLLD